MIKNMDMAYIIGKKIKKYMKGTGSMECSMEEGNTQIQRRQSMVFGKRGNA